ncbi:hypothetical protein PT974_09459 [Cladobotryum mycophilum]|uniref:SnoaL-like domain-containing protein n=1 Tax=Cladobotryum mycophilum TaxID=491253 RepID=A0ABR0SGB7_9HYPO
MSTPEQAWIALTQRTDLIKAEDAAAAFAALKPVTADYMTGGSGSWEGFNLDTGHPTKDKMIELHWAGKNFRSTEDVEPIVVYDAEGKRTWNKDWGYARLREMKFGDSNTIAMLYDDFPIVDYFHYVTDDLVAGAMDSKKMNSFGTYYFYLKRIA